MKRMIAKLTRNILSSELLSKISNGVFDKIINIDMNSVIQKYNDGDTSVLASEEITDFIKNGEQISSLVNIIIQLKNLLTLKKYFLRDVEEQKNKMIYNPNDNYCIGYIECTYQNVIDAISLAERILGDKKIYQVLNFYLKYQTLIKKIEERKKVFSLKKDSSEFANKFLDILRTGDNEVGIIRTEKVEDGEKKVSVNVGTRKDMALSDLIGKPFEADLDRAGYDYGPHGDYYMPAKKVTKTFHQNGETELHRKMILEEKAKRMRLAMPRVDEDGYIICGHRSVIVSKGELIEARIDPESIGWKPLKLNIIPVSLLDLTKSDGRRYNIAEIIEMKADLLTKGRK